MDHDDILNYYEEKLRKLKVRALTAMTKRQRDEIRTEIRNCERIIKTLDKFDNPIQYAELKRMNGMGG